MFSESYEFRLDYTQRDHSRAGRQFEENYNFNHKEKIPNSESFTGPGEIIEHTCTLRNNDEFETYIKDFVESYKNNKRSADA